MRPLRRARVWLRLADAFQWLAWKCVARAEGAVRQAELEAAGT